MTSSSKNKLPKKRGIWLVGGTLEAITGSKLPSNQQVLARFFHLHSDEKRTVHDSATTTARDVLHFWEKARIPTRQEQHVIKKIKDLHAKWKNIQKSASRRNESQIAKEAEFTDNFGDLFDIAHARALELILLDEDKEFLLAQREKGRRGTMGPVDNKLAKQEERLQQREDKMESRKRKEGERVALESSAVELSCSSSSSSSSSSSIDSDKSSSVSKYIKVTSQPSKQQMKQSKQNKKFINPDVAAALDRTKTSDRNAMYVLSATVQSLGQSTEDVVLSRETIRRVRRQFREKISNEIHQSFAPNIPLTVHWDGKMLPALMSKETVERLAVLVSGEGVMKLLGVPKIPNGTGEAQAAAVFNLIQDWNLTERVQCMCFDTTASNTGNKAGACVLLEQKLNKNLLSTACRHHMFELIAANVFSVLMGTSSGPNIKLFQRFAEYWKCIDRETFESGMKEESISLLLESSKDELVMFIRSQLSNFQPRDDYKELLQLSLLFLGESIPGSTILAPGAFHRARWMAKLIYCLKIYMFRSQFHLTAKETTALREFNVFLLHIYLKAWYTAPCSITAPNNDLDLLKKLVDYKKINEAVASAAIKTFSRHLWYLSESLVALAFYDVSVPVQTKVKMVEALACPTDEESLPRTKIEEKQISSMQLFDFVTSNTRKFFVALDIPQGFLKENPATWEINDEYIAAKGKILKMKVVNDAAERGIALIQSFNTVLSNQEEQKQFILQIVENHRKNFPNANKSTITQGLCKK